MARQHPVANGPGKLPAVVGLVRTVWPVPRLGSLAMRGVPPSTAAPVVAVPALAAADPDAGGHGRPEPPIGCEAVPFCCACDAPGLFGGGPTIVGGATALGLSDGGSTVGPLGAGAGWVMGRGIAAPGTALGVPAPTVGAVDDAPVLPELDPALPLDEPVCADANPALASKRAADIVAMRR